MNASISFALKPVALPLSSMTFDFQSLPLPHFLPGPHGSWVVPAVGWHPATIQDLVGTEPPFAPVPAHGPRSTSVLDTLPGLRLRHMGRLSPAQIAYFDPCYFTAGLLPHPNNAVPALPTIQEEEPWFTPCPGEDTSPPTDLRDVGVQTSDIEWEHGALGIEDAAVQTSDYGDEASDGFTEVAVQTDP